MTTNWAANEGLFKPGNCRQDRDFFSLRNVNAAGTLNGYGKLNRAIDRDRRFDWNDHIPCGVSVGSEDIEHAAINRNCLGRIGIENPKLILFDRRVIDLQSVKHRSRQSATAVGSPVATLGRTGVSVVKTNPWDLDHRITKQNFDPKLIGSKSELLKCF